MADELSPKQIEFLRLYNDPKSELFGNAVQSALKAGYAQQYAESITALMPDWLSEKLGRRKRMLEKAETRLEELLDAEDDRVKADIAKFVAKTQGKNEGYSEKTELEHKGEVNINHIDEEQALRIIQRRTPSVPSAIPE